MSGLTMIASLTPIYGIWATPVSRKPGSPDHWVTRNNDEPWLTSDYDEALRTIKKLQDQHEAFAIHWPVPMWCYAIKIYDNTPALIVYGSRIYSEIKI